MIKFSELRDFRPQYRYQNGKGITLESVTNAIRNRAVKLGIPAAFMTDKVKAGGLLNGTLEDCTVLYHPDHPNDYIKFCIRVKEQGTYVFVTINEFGSSKQMSKANLSSFAKRDRQGESIGYQIGSIINEKLMTLGKNEQKLEEEQMYYRCLLDIFNEIVY